MKLAKSISSLGLALFAVSITAIPAASAHVYETSNGVSAILHIKPDDRPVAKEATTINLKFNDEAGGFSLNDYKVTLSVSADGVKSQTSEITPAFFGAAAEGETVVTFPQAAVYSFQAKGTPIRGEAAPFTLNYTARVTDNTIAATAKGDGNTVLLLSGFSLILIGMVAGKVIHSGGRYRGAKA